MERLVMSVVLCRVYILGIYSGTRKTMKKEDDYYDVEIANEHEKKSIVHCTQTHLICSRN